MNQLAHSHGKNSNPPVLTFENVSFSYGPAPVLEKVNFSIPQGTFISIVGPNAGGKTTLLKLMLGLLQPNEGRIEIFGKPPEKARPRIGYMPQYLQFDPKFPVNVLDVVLMGRLRSGFHIGPYTQKDKQIAMDALAKLDMDAFYQRPFMALSGGQRQRVLIARALAAEPQLLLLDEPTANVDMATETELFTRLHTMSQDITVLVVSHDLGFVCQYVESVVCVNRQVKVHPTTAMNGDIVNELYGSKVRQVNHQHQM